MRTCARAAARTAAARRAPALASWGAQRAFIQHFETLQELKELSVAENGDKPLFGTKNPSKGAFEWLSYRKWGRKVDSFSAVLHQLGVRKGDRVAVISNNRVEWAVGSFGTYALGGVYVPMYEAQKAEDWEYILADSGAKVLLCATEQIYNMVKDWPGKVGQLEAVLCFDTTGEAPHAFHHQLAKADAGAYSPAPKVVCGPEDLASLIYTSGTTGKPKGVQLTHRNLSSNVTGVKAVFPNYETEIMNGDDVSLAFLPWAHCYGQNCELHSAFANGTAIGIAEGTEKLLDNLAEVKPTILYSVPTLYKRVYDGVMAKMAAETPVKRKLFEAAVAAGNAMRLAKTAGQEPNIFTRMQHAVLDKLVLGKIRERMGGRLRMAFAGGAATPKDVLVFFENIGVPIIEGYGLTETSPIVVINSHQYPTRKLGMAGVPVEDCTVRILTDGTEVPVGQEGEICVAGPNVMKGYWNNEEANAEVFLTHEGKKFFRTGDMGRVDERNRLAITGRFKEQYKLENGKYVVPGPLEDALCSSPYIQQAVIWGDNKPYNVALMVPDRAVFDPWLVKHAKHLVGQPWSVVSAHPAVQELFHGEVEMIVSRNVLKKYEVPRRWHLVEDAFSTANGFLTPKLSLKRHVIFQVYKEQLEELYTKPDARVAEQEAQAEQLAA